MFWNKAIFIELFFLKKQFEKHGDFLLVILFKNVNVFDKFEEKTKISA